MMDEYYKVLSEDEQMHVWWWLDVEEMIRIIFVLLQNCIMKPVM